MEEIQRGFDIKTRVQKEKKDHFLSRISYLDVIRGILIILVMFDHFMYNMRDFLPQYFKALEISSGWFYDFAQSFILGPRGSNTYFDMRAGIREFCLCLFLLLSGISCAFSRDNWKRAVKMVSFWLGLALITNIANGYAEKFDLGFYSLVINFNVIGVVATSVLIYCFVQKKSPTYLFFFVMALFVIGFFIGPMLEYHLSDQPALLLPFFRPSGIDGIMVNGHFYLMSDYLPLFPYVIFFFIGAIIAKICYANPKQHLHTNRNWMRPLAFVGRNSLLFYLVHQFVLYLLFIFVGFCMGVY